MDDGYSEFGSKYDVRLVSFLSTDKRIASRMYVCVYVCMYVCSWSIVGDQLNNPLLARATQQIDEKERKGKKSRKVN